MITVLGRLISFPAVRHFETNVADQADAWMCRHLAVAMSGAVSGCYKSV